MRIASWNCNGKFREKFKQIVNIAADIYVIQECENPANYRNTEYNNFASNYIWVGQNPNKGLAVFVKNNIHLRKNNWNSYYLRNFISANINNEFDLVCVWACKPYIEEYYRYQKINIANYNENTIIIGDFNSNAIWDYKHNKRNHTNVVKELESKKLISAYHYIFNEEQGKEKHNTFYLYRHLDKGYHIDYCFIEKNRIKNFKILHHEIWLNFSDHIPILVEI